MGKRSSLVPILLHIKEHVNERIADFFAWWAEIAFDYPYHSICATLILTAVCCIGFLPGIPKWIDGADALYSLPFSVARSQGAVHRVLFNETNARPTFIIVTGTKPGENIFTWKHLEAVKQLDRLIRGQTVDPKHGRRIAIPRSPHYHVPSQQKLKKLAHPAFFDAFNASLGSSLPSGGRSLPENVNRLIELINNPSAKRATNDRGDAGHDVLTFQDICVRNPFGDCAVTGIQEMGVDETRDLLLEPGAPPALLVFDGLVFNTQKKAFPPHYVLGKAKEVPCSPELPKSMLLLVYPPDRLIPGSNSNLARTNMTCITEAQAFQLVYEVQENEALTKRNENWEKVLIDVLSDNMQFGPLSVTMNAFRSRDDALRSSTSESSDVLYVGLTFGLLLAYSTGLNFSCDLYRSKAYPALAGLLAATLGLITGMGFMSLWGIAFVPTALVCPFLVIGVGTDDLFVIINGYAMTYMIDSAKYRCILSLRETGLGISMTTITSLVSFLIGLNTGYLSIKNFCWFCGAGMFFGYIYVFTFFFPIHCLDARREEENQACLFCVPQNERRHARREQLRKEGVQIHQGAEIGIFTLGALMVRRAEQDGLRRHALNLRRHMLQKEASTIDNEEQKTSERTADKAFELESVTQPTINSDSPGIESVTTREKCLETRSQTSFGKLPQRSVITNMLIQIFSVIKEHVQADSDALLSRVALDGHRAGLLHGADASPSHGVLNFTHLDPEVPSTGDPVEDIVHHQHIPLHYRSLLTGERKLFLEEPKGNVGLKWHKFFICYYGALLVHPWTKVAVFITFGLFMMTSIYGCCHLESGLDLKDLAPLGSYLNRFDLNQAQYFNEYDFPVDVFFPEPHEWWKPEAQQSLRMLEALMNKTGSGKLVTNPVVRMLDDPELQAFLQSGDREIFETALHAALATERSKYKQFEQNFVWEGTHLRAWKMQILPAPMFSSAQRAAWMTQIRADCEAQMGAPYPMKVMAWNYMMTFYESDLQINSSVTSNMLVAAATMLVIALIGIPQLKAGFLVILVMGMIDVGIIGCMYFWGIKLNMVSMICLLIAVGFSVDFSCHVCHTYMEAEGETRNQRVIETLVIMGNPVFHGAASSIIGILMLGFSGSYIFQVFFKMMTLVMVFSLAHGVIFLPVLLSVASDVRPRRCSKQLQQKKEEKYQTTKRSSERRHRKSPHSVTGKASNKRGHQRSLSTASSTGTDSRTQKHTYPLHQENAPLSAASSGRKQQQQRNRREQEGLQGYQQEVSQSSHHTLIAASELSSNVSSTFVASGGQRLQSAPPSSDSRRVVSHGVHHNERNQSSTSSETLDNRGFYHRDVGARQSCSRECSRSADARGQASPHMSQSGQRKRRDLGGKKPLPTQDLSSKREPYSASRKSIYRASHIESRYNQRYTPNHGNAQAGRHESKKHHHMCNGNCSVT